MVRLPDLLIFPCGACRCGSVRAGTVQICVGRGGVRTAEREKALGALPVVRDVLERLNLVCVVDRLCPGRVLPGTPAAR
jgi:hypothetical protein